MRLRNLDEIKEHGNGNALVFEMNGNHHVCLVIRRRPCVGSEAEGALVLLQGMLSSSLFYS